MADYRLFGNPSAPVCFLQPVDDHDLADMGAETDALRALCPGADWCIAAVPVGEWNQDLTPWSAPPVFGKTPFGDGAPRTLKRLLEEVIPALEAEHPAQRRYAVCGYSLAGLFALWAGCETDRFCGVAAASPSVWYPGWLDYAEAHPPRAAAVIPQPGRPRGARPQPGDGHRGRRHPPPARAAHRAGRPRAAGVEPRQPLRRQRPAHRERDGVGDGEDGKGVRLF